MYTLQVKQSSGLRLRYNIKIILLVLIFIAFKAAFFCFVSIGLVTASKVLYSPSIKPPTKKIEDNGFRYTQQTCRHLQQ